MLVSIALATPPTTGGRSLTGGKTYFLLRRLHSLTGLVFGGYLVVHLIVNATLIQQKVEGHDPFEVQVGKIHSLPFLLLVECLLIYLPILYHTAYGIWIVLTGQPNVNNYPYTKNWFYLLQRISAVIIVLFLLFHVLGMKGLLGSHFRFSMEAPRQSVEYHMQASWIVPWVIYPIGVLASCYHLANGFWTAAITWGLTVSESAQRRWGYVCTGLFFLTLVCGLLALAALVSAAHVTATWN
jgi:succinate dehydrogenase / fumarate reductase cytochrome b subunit